MTAREKPAEPLPATHLCSFRGERVPPPEPETVTCAITGRTATVTNAERLGRCEGEVPHRGRCSKRATTVVRYVWGCCAFCDKHAEEECGS